MTPRTAPLVAAFVTLLAPGPFAQQPGDRPAPNTRATRSVVMARRAMIATSQPLASAAGLQVMREGGNAVDAAVTAAAVLAVVEPTMNGVGGDLFAIVYDPKTKALTGLNASGRAGRLATPEEFAKRGVKRMPEYGPSTITVPGVVDGWAELLKRHGTISLARALAPAIAYARDGFPVSEIIAVQWKGEEKRLASDPASASTFLIGGRAPATGQVFSNPRLAATLEQVAAGGADAFYRGPIAAAIVKDLRARQALVDEGDFAAHHSDWVQPVSTRYRGFDVFELPFNTQGFVALEMLNILEGFELPKLGHNSAAYLHLLIEANRIAFADRAAYLSDPGSVPAATQAMLLSKDYAARRRGEIRPERAAESYAPGRPPSGGARQPAVDFQVSGTGDTVYLTAADGDGHVISLIQSLYDAFGSGVVAGDTGVVLQNRGALFTLEAGHPNLVAPGKRPFHTLVPAMVMKDGRPWLSFGVMGGDMQPQGHVQVLLNLVEFGMNVQEAGEAARYRLTGSGVALESAMRPEVPAGLLALQHPVVQGRGLWGGFQGILIDPRSGVLMGGSDPRKDGLAIGF
jgi:gamma-glutamyltranspeptidase / glutathione hydrolase